MVGWGKVLSFSLSYPTTTYPYYYLLLLTTTDTNRPTDTNRRTQTDTHTNRKNLKVGNTFGVQGTSE
jgi:hypothetical protein